MRSIIAIWLISLASAATLAEEVCKRIVQDDGARKIAIGYLYNHNLQSQYERYPESTVEQGCYWVVTFNQVNQQSKIQSKGVALVNKENGKVK